MTALAWKGLLVWKVLIEDMQRGSPVSTPVTEAKDKVGYVPMKKTVPILWLQLSPQDICGRSISHTKTGLQMHRSPCRKEGAHTPIVIPFSKVSNISSPAPFNEW